MWYYANEGSVSQITCELHDLAVRRATEEQATIISQMIRATIMFLNGLDPTDFVEIECYLDADNIIRFRCLKNPHRSPRSSL